MAKGEENRLVPPTPEAIHDTGEADADRPEVDKSSRPAKPLRKKRRIKPAKKSAHFTRHGNARKRPVKTPVPTGSKTRDGKDLHIPLGKKSSDGRDGKPAPIDRDLPPGQSKNPNANDTLAIPTSKKPVDVGYGKPPVSTRFAAGTSGNPAGRPRGAKNKVRAFGLEQLKETALAELYRDIETTEGGEQITQPAATLILRKMVQKGMEGDPRAAQMLLSMGQDIEREQKAEQLEHFQVAVDYKVGWTENFALCDAKGIPRPEVYPHPDHVIINYDTGDVKIDGPCSLEEKVQVDKFLKGKEAYAREISEIEADLRDKSKARYRKHLQQDLVHAKKIREIIDKLIPEWAVANLKKPAS